MLLACNSSLNLPSAPESRKATPRFFLDCCTPGRRLFDEEKTMRKGKDITGDRFGKLVAMAFHSQSPYKDGGKRWLFKCDCGNEIIRHIHEARNVGHCGCMTDQHLAEGHKKIIKHGMAGTKDYQAWDAMRQRCVNPNNSAYSYYGGRGIKVCERWMKSFENFLSDMGPRPPKATIDRRDNNGNYEPGNCVWATRKEQQQNRRGNVYYTIGAETKCLMEWCEQYNISYGAVRGRVNRGWDVEKAITTSPNAKFDGSAFRTKQHYEQFQQSNFDGALNS